MDETNYDNICRHVGHMYLTSQFQIQRKEKEALEIMLQNQQLREEINNLKKALAAQETDEPRPERITS